MDFQLSSSLKKILEEIRAFLDEEILPLEKEFLEKKKFSHLLPHLREKRDMVKEKGWWLPHLSREHGGMGLKLTEFAHVSEVLGRSPLGHYVFNCQAPDVGNMEILIDYGTEEQKERFLDPLLKGEIRSCFSMTEPDSPGSNPAWMKTLAKKEDGLYIITGRKWFTTGADGATFAILMALTNPEASKYKRASMIIVPTDNPGFVLERNTSFMGETGDDFHSHSEILYDNCQVPQSYRLGPEGEGFAIAQERLGPGRIHHCMRWIGICERAFDLMCKRACSREVAPGVPLSDKQIVRQWIATSRAEIDGARLLVLRTAWKIEKEGAKAARNDISLIKFQVAGILQKVLDRAIQTHGALGVTDYTPLAFFYRTERSARIYDGPDEVHQMAVARRILRDYS